MKDILREIEIEKRRVILTENKTPISYMYLAQVEQFLHNLTPTDVGIKKIGPYRIHFEGFTDDYIQSVEDRTYLPKDDPFCLERFDDIYVEVLRDFINRENGNFPIDHGLIGNKENPIYYAIFQVEELKENIINFPKKIDANDIDKLVRKIHRNENDFYEKDITDRIYWFKNYILTNLELDVIDLNKFEVDEDLVKKYIEHIKFSPKTMPPIVYDPINGLIIDGIHRANAYARIGKKTIPAYVGNEKSDTFGEYKKYINEASPDTIEGSFTPDLIASKKWLTKILSKLLFGKRPRNIYVLGSWYGNMGIFLKEAGIEYDRLILVEPDQKKADISKKLLSDINKRGKLLVFVKKAEDIEYEPKSVVINTSCNETGPLFMTKIPDNTLCLLQARNNVSDVLIETDTLDEFDELFPMKKTILLSERKFTDPETKYCRFMKVGRK
jgi:hypothetical protein